MADNLNNSTEVVATPTDGNVENNPENPAPQPQRPGFFGIVKSLVVRMVIIYMISSFFRRSTPPKDSSGAAVAGMTPATNIYSRGMQMDLYVFVNEERIFTRYNDKTSFFWMEDGVVYGDWKGGFLEDGSYIKTGNITLSKSVQSNATLYIHIFIVEAGNSPNPDDDSYVEKTTVNKSHPLTVYKKRRFHKNKNLLTGETEVHHTLRSNGTDFDIVSNWHPNLTVNLIDDVTPWTAGSVPAPLNEYIVFLPGGLQYKPILYINNYWNLNKDYTPINETISEALLQLTFSPMSLFKWQIYAAQGMKSKWYSFLGDDMAGDSDDDQDSLKQTLTDTSPYLLAVTIIVSIVHSIFEFLAFKNDIQFWKNRKSLQGLSVRSVFFNVFQSLIVLLYVLDNETNFVIKCSVFVGLGIEIWKIFKVVNVKLDRETTLFWIIPRVVITEKSTYTESETKKYDTIAFKYLGWLLFPLLSCYCVYSLVYVEHKGWYSWVLSVLYGFLLTFGFIMMTPQLFINYKLKSVAHLPWRMLTYKALNTFIDDLFAFVIKMPTLYRLGCFRDDIIFLIYLYQRYIYRVDPKRVNEYGTSEEMLQDCKSAAITNGVEALTEKGDMEKKND